MLPAPVNTNATDPPAALLASCAAHLALKGRGNTAHTTAAKTFVARWPHVQDWALRPLHLQLAAYNATKPFVTFPGGNPVGGLMACRGSHVACTPRLVHGGMQ